MSELVKIPAEAKEIIKNKRTGKVYASKTDFDNLANWGWGDDDYCDPFHWSSTSNPNTSVSAWNIIDSAKDFVAENRTNNSSLKELRDELYDFLADLEILLEEEAVLN